MHGNRWLDRVDLELLGVTPPAKAQPLHLPTFSRNVWAPQRDAAGRLATDDYGKPVMQKVAEHPRAAAQIREYWSIDQLPIQLSRQEAFLPIDAAGVRPFLKSLFEKLGVRVVYSDQHDTGLYQDVLAVPVRAGTNQLLYHLAQLGDCVRAEQHSTHRDRGPAETAEARTRLAACLLRVALDGYLPGTGRGAAGSLIADSDTVVAHWQEAAAEPPARADRLA